MLVRSNFTSIAVRCPTGTEHIAPELPHESAYWDGRPFSASRFSVPSPLIASNAIFALKAVV
jgi:hypothetical protein